VIPAKRFLLVRYRPSVRTVSFATTQAASRWTVASCVVSIRASPASVSAVDNAACSVLVAFTAWTSLILLSPAARVTVRLSFGSVNRPPVSREESPSIQFPAVGPQSSFLVRLALVLASLPRNRIVRLARQQRSGCCLVIVVLCSCFRIDSFFVVLLGLSPALLAIGLALHPWS
jgi:hypothetical protein